MKSSAAISDAGPTVEDPSIKMLPERPESVDSLLDSAAHPAKINSDAEERAASLISFFKISPLEIV
jgi:hypothetical protein